MWVIVMAGCTSGHGSLGGGESWNTGGSGGESSGGGSTNTNSSGGGGFEAGGAGPMGGSDAAPPPMVDAGPMTCAAPADCMPGQVCCGKLNLTLANMTCGIQSFDKACQTSANCPTTATLACATQQVRVCAASMDCIEAKFPNCCTFTFGMQQATFCVDSVVATLATTCN
jgi:hypothetical protein